MTELTGQVAIITGASHQKGIGFAIASRLADMSMNVVMTDVEQSRMQLEDAAEALRAEKARSVVALPLDVTRPDQIGEVVQSINADHGRIDVLVNNAGVGGGSAKFLELSLEQLNLCYSVNVGGIVNVSQAVIPYMLRNGGGSIINIASLCGLGAIEGIPAAYTASKFAAVGLTKAMALEYASQGIRCNAICPGVVNTDMRDRLLERLSAEQGISIADAERLEDEAIGIGRGANPDEIATAVAFLASPASSYLTGVAMPVAGGMAAGL